MNAQLRITRDAVAGLQNLVRQWQGPRYPFNPGAIAIYGSRLAKRLYWLESIVGPRGRGKFEHAKLDTGVLAGQYVSGVIDTKQGRKIVCDLIDQLEAGQVVALCDINSYYLHGKRRQTGMIIRGDTLIDLWP